MSWRVTAICSDEFDKGHSDELDAFCNYINNLLRDDPAAQPYLPLTAPTMFNKLHDGVVLSRLLDNPKPGALDEGVITAPLIGLPPADLEAMKKRNGVAVLQGASRVGCDVRGVTPEDIVNGHESPVIQLVSELLRLQGLSDLPSKTGPEMDALRQPGESGADLRALPGEVLAARWLNKSLEKAGIPPKGQVDDPSVCEVQPF